MFSYASQLSLDSYSKLQQWPQPSRNINYYNSLKHTLSNMDLQISKMAFFKVRDIFSSQIPYLELIGFFLFLFMFIIRALEYRNIYISEADSFKNTETRYLLKIKIHQSLEWSNIAVTQCFIFMTLGLSMSVGCVFALRGHNEATITYDKYNNNPMLNEHDKNMINLLSDQMVKFIVIFIFNLVDLILLALQFITIVILKYRNKLS